MPILALLIIGLQVFFGMHVVRTGRDKYWLWIIIMAPGIGCAVYFFTQFLPEASKGMRAQRAKRSLLKAVNPERELRKRKDSLALSDTVENRVSLADECIDAGMPDQAIELLNGIKSPLHADDPAVMEKLAVAHFENDSPQQTIKVLDNLIDKNPDYKSTNAHLLYAKSLESLQRYDEACSEYEVLKSSYPGEEARVRYGLLLEQMGRDKEANEIFSESLLRVRQAPKHYRKKEKEWLKIAKQKAQQ